MRRAARFIVLMASIATISVLLSVDCAHAQRLRPVRRGMVVFVGGYFYDPFFGPYPWWPRAAYPHPYYPVFDNRAVLRVLVVPHEAAVHVDGFYAGIVEDFNGFFEGLPLPPGGHEIALHLEGYRTIRRSIYLGPGSTFRLQHTMERLAAGDSSEPPSVAPPIPPPPEGSFIPPRTPARTPPRPRAAAAPPAAAYGTLSLRVQPEDAEVWIDGERWASSDGGRFAIQLSGGPHRVEVIRSGYRDYSAEVQLRDGETTSLNVSLMPERP